MKRKFGFGMVVFGLALVLLFAVAGGGLVQGLNLADSVIPEPPPGYDCPTFAWPPCQPDPTADDETELAGLNKPYAMMFIDPQNGETIYESVTVLVYVPFSNPQRAEPDVRLEIGNGGWQKMYPQGDGMFALKWDTTQYRNGWYTLTALYVDEVGEERLTQIQVNVCQRLMPCIP